MKIAPSLIQNALSAIALGLWWSGTPLFAAASPRPEGIAESDWSSIIAAHDAAERAIVSGADRSHAARNPSQSWNIDFDGRGFSIKPDSADWRWGLRLRRYETGRTFTLRKPQSVKSEANRLVYRWDDTVQEWFVNTSRGLQQGWIFSRKPADPSDLQLVLGVAGGLKPRISSDANSISFDTEPGQTALTYSGLHAWDADGRLVPVRFAPVTGDAAAFAVRVDASQARFPVTIDPIAQQAYLKASNTEAMDEFGISVAISGDTVIVGARSEDSAATGVNGNQVDNSLDGAGAAYVFVRNGSVWTQQAYLKASNTGMFDLFGSSVAIEGDTVVIGAVGESSAANIVNGDQTDNSAAGAGAVYVFVRSGVTWTQQAYLKASNTGAGDEFGQSLAIAGDTLIVGAAGEDSAATGVNGSQANNAASRAGAAYVFVRSGALWSQQAYLKASNTDANDNFGGSVAISGDTIIVGAVVEAGASTGVNGNQADNSASEAGAAYVFVRNGVVWSQQAYLKASNTAAGDKFSNSVAVSGDTAVVAAPGEDSAATGVNRNQADNSADSAGAAYVFVRNGAVWSQQAYLKASNTNAVDTFGNSVAVLGDTAVVGAAFEDSAATGVNGNQADNSASSAGAAYVFVRDRAKWTQQAYLKASNTGAGDIFGAALAISGNTVIVGASFEDSASTGVNGSQTDNSAGNAGAAYVFQFPKPTVKAKGKRRINTSRNRVVLRGSAVDASHVEFKVGSGGFKPAKGIATKWRIPVQLKKTRTVAKVRALGPGGASKTLKIIVRRE